VFLDYNIIHFNSIVLGVFYEVIFIPSFLFQPISLVALFLFQLKKERNTLLTISIIINLFTIIGATILFLIG
jgi:hypothetical protein